MTPKERVALVSLLASVALGLAKLAAALATGSLALLSEAANSLIDVGATLATLIAVRIADAPADERHPYGHGKVEALSALAQTGLLVALGVGIGVEAVRRLLAEPEPLDRPWLAILALGFAVAVDLWRWRALRRAAREHRSEALAADAAHFSVDLVASALVLGAVGLSSLGFLRADAIASLLVAGLALVTAVRLGRRTTDALLDAAPRAEAAELRRLIAAVPGVVGEPVLRLRSSGASLHGDVRIGVSRTLPLARVVSLKAAVERAAREALPHAELLVVAEPVALDNESVLERVILAAARRRTPVHRVVIQRLPPRAGDEAANEAGRLAIGLDIEVDGALTLREAHAVADGIEAALRAEFGPDTEVDTHIEPLPPEEPRGEDAPEAERLALAALIAAEAAADADGDAEAGPGPGRVAVRDVHAVRARRGRQGLIVSFHCRADAEANVAAVHAAVDRVERRVRTRAPHVARVIGHAEP